MRGIFAGLLLVIAPVGAYAGAGEASGEFLRIVPDSRSAAMGEAATALADDASAVYWNPAALALADKRSVLLSHSAYIGSGNLGFAGVSARRGVWGAGLSAQYFNAGFVGQTDLSGAEQGEFTPSDLALTCAAARAVEIPSSSRFSRASVGVGVKYVRTSLLKTAQTEAVDVGVLAEAFERRLRAGLTAANLGGKLKYESEAFSLPAIMRGGVSYALSSNWRFSIEGGVPFQGTSYGAAGVEAVVVRTRSLAFSVRGGFNSRLIEGVDGFRTISMGFGLEGPIRLDYALVPMGNLGLVHRASLGLAF